MGVSTLFLSTAIVPFLIAGYRVVLRGHGQRKPTDIPLIVTALAWGLALVTLAPAVQAFESTLVPSLGRLLSNICTLVAACGLLTLVSHVSYVEDKVRPKVRIRLITLLIVVTVMAVMFFASRPPSGRGIFTGLYRSQPTLAVYTLVYATYLAYAVVALAALALRSLRGARSWLRVGMILIVGGSVLYAGYLIQKVVSVANELVSGSPAEPFCASAFATLECAFAIAMPAYAVLLVVLGTTVPTLGPWLQHLIRGIRHRRSLHRLRPLWEIVHEAQPDIIHAIPVRPWSPSWPGHIAELLYRRVIAIRDGLLALQPYRDPTDTHEYRRQAAAGLSDRRRAAAIEAADICAAVHRRQHNMAPREYVPSSNATIAQDDLDSEVRWLTLVSDALTRSEPPPIQS